MKASFRISDILHLIAASAGFFILELSPIGFGEYLGLDEIQQTWNLYSGGVLIILCGIWLIILNGGKIFDGRNWVRLLATVLVLLAFLHFAFLVTSTLIVGVR